MTPKASVYIATSLDGFIARSDGGLDWLKHEAGSDDYGYYDFMASVDTLVMGRNSYEKVLTFDQWSYEGTPVVVLSQTLTDVDVPAHLTGIVTISAETPKALVDRLGNEGRKRLYIDGGKIIQSFLNAGLIQELIITRIPVLIGEGIPLFGPVNADIKLTHVETTAYASGLVQSRYRVP